MKIAALFSHKSKRKYNIQIGKIQALPGAQGQGFLTGGNFFPSVYMVLQKLPIGIISNTDALVAV